MSDPSGQKKSPGERSIVVEGNAINCAFVTGDNNQVTVVWSDGIRSVIALVPPAPRLLIGREQLLAEIQADFPNDFTSEPERSHVRHGEAIALTGTAGVGKTTLAIALVYEPGLLRKFAGGVLWGSLGQAPNLDDVLNRWGDALGVDVTQEPTTQRRANRVQVALRGRPFLFVLDDVWVQDHAVALEQAMGPGSACLITTRDESIALRLAPNRIYHIDTLSAPSAADLLAIWCPAVASERDALQRLASAVGGLPLALTLVGGYLVDNVTFAGEARAAFGVLAKAEKWLGLIDRDRQRSLRDVIKLSVDELPKPVRRVFAGLAAFAPKPATFSLAAANDVANTKIPTGLRGLLARRVVALGLGMYAKIDEAAIGLLVRRNLLEKVGEDRVALHQTVGAVAMEQDLAQGRLRDHQGRHARYYVYVDQNPDAWRRIEPDLLQIRHAWNWVSSEAKDEELVLGYVWALANFQNRRGLWREQIAWHERGRTAAVAMGRRRTEARLLVNIGTLYGSLGEQQKALDYLEKALPIEREVGDRRSEATTLNNIGRIHSRLGEPQKALVYLKQALSIGREIGDRMSEAMALSNITAEYYELGERTEALDYLERALSLMRGLGNRAGEAFLLSNIGSAYEDLEEREKALDYYKQALSIEREIGNRDGEARALYGIASLHQSDNQLKTAVELLEQVVEIHQAIGHPNLDNERAKLEEVRASLGTSQT